MDFEQQLEQVAESYQAQGYQVKVRPGPDDLPTFAKDFHVEILAKRGDGNVLTSAKATPSEFQADTNLSRYAEVLGKQPGWRYDLLVLGPDPRPALETRDAKDSSEEEIVRLLDDVDRIRKAGFTAPAFIAAWAALESAMRHILHRRNLVVGEEFAPRSMLSVLLSSGILDYGDSKDLEYLFQLRNMMVHGYSAPVPEPEDVQFLSEIVRRLLPEAVLATRTA